MAMDLAAEQQKLVAFVKAALQDAPLSEDLGDYLPFLAAVGERSFCDQQVALATRSFRNGFAVGDAFPKLRRYGNSLLVPELNTDTLLGFLELFRITRDPALLTHADRLVSALLRDFAQPTGTLVPGATRRPLHLAGFRIPRLRYSVPLARGMNGLYAELLCDFAELSGNSAYRDRAEQLADAWLAEPFFQATGLFPAATFFSNRWRNQFLADSRTVTHFKPNTSVANGLLAVYESTRTPRYREALLRWFSAVEQKLTTAPAPDGANASEGAVHLSWDARTSQRSTPTLLAAFPTIDLCCDAAHILGPATPEGKKLMAFAERIARFWLSKRTPLGLIPQQASGGPTLLDSITDFSMSLFRLHELTHKPYHTAALALVEANLRHHAVTPDDSWAFIGGKPAFLPALAESVDSATGIPTKTVKPKFVALALKPLIYLRSGKRMYETPSLRKLLRDR